MKHTLFTVASTAGLLGIGFAWCVEYAYGTPLLARLGVSRAHLALVWLAGPVSGLVAQPLFGAVSDALRCNAWRRVFVVASTAVLSTAIALVAVASKCAEEASNQAAFAAEPRRNRVAVAIAVLAFFLLDFAINAVTVSSRALVLSVTQPHNQAIANAWTARMSGLGTVLGYMVGWIDFGGDDARQLQTLCVVAVVVLVFSVAIACWASLMVEEARTIVRVRRVEQIDSGTSLLSSVSSPTRLSPYANVYTQLIGTFTLLFSTLNSLPALVLAVCRVQLWAWIAWFPFLFYASSWVAQQPGGSVRAGSRALLANAVVSLATMMLAPRMVGASHATGYEGRLFAIWAGSLVLFFMLMQATLLVRGVGWATVLIAAVGVPWGVANWAPFGVLAEVIAEEEVGTRPTVHDSVEMEEAAVDLDNDGATLGPAQSRAGMILGIHNMYIVFPQFIATLLSSFIFWLSQGDASSARDSFGLSLRVASVCALVAAGIADRVARKGAV